MPKRYFLHPIFQNPRSRSIFFWFLILGAALGGAVWLQVRDILQAAGLQPGSTIYGDSALEGFLLHPLGFWALVVTTAALAASYTAHKVLGPIQRIEEWLTSIQKGNPASNIKLRRGDRLEMFVRLSEEILARQRR